MSLDWRDAHRNDDGLSRLLAIGVWVAVNRALSPIDHLEERMCLINYRAGVKYLQKNWPKTLRLGS